MAIKKLIFDDKSVDAKTLYDALQSNWGEELPQGPGMMMLPPVKAAVPELSPEKRQEYRQLRQMIINDVPHYGNDVEEVDELAAWGLGTFAKIMKGERGPRGKYSGGTFTVTAHIMLGAMLGATPDGRVAGEPIADAISSRQGYDKNGPTAYLISAAKLPHDILSNGDQLNIRFTPSSVRGDEGAQKLRDLFATYFKLGGMQVQFNVVSTDKLREAQSKPLENKDLIVRIAGFSTYFVTLDSKIQEDFITRTENSL
jgi:formate C-acetyltransferase